MLSYAHYNLIAKQTNQIKTQTLSRRPTHSSLAYPTCSSYVGLEWCCYMFLFCLCSLTVSVSLMSVYFVTSALTLVGHTAVNSRHSDLHHCHTIVQSLITCLLEVKGGFFWLACKVHRPVLCDRCICMHDLSETFPFIINVFSLQSRPKLWIKSTKWWLATYSWIYIIMIKATHCNFLFSLTQ